MMARRTCGMRAFSMVTVVTTASRGVTAAATARCALVEGGNSLRARFRWAHPASFRRFARSESFDRVLFQLAASVWPIVVVKRLNCHLRNRWPGMTRALFGVSASGASWAFLGSGRMAANDAIKKCDELYETGQMEEAYAAIMAVSSDVNPEVQWRVARMNFKMAERSAKLSEKEKAIKDGLLLLQANLEKTPRCPNTHKWIAILLGSKDKHDSFKQQIEEAFIIKDHLMKTLEYNPSDGYAHYVLGKWCFQVASVSWYQKKIAQTLFASPPESTYEEALKHFKIAEKLKPNIFTACFLMAAKCLLESGDKAEAGRYLAKCIEQESRDQESRANADEARKLAKRHGISL